MTVPHLAAAAPVDLDEPLTVDAGYARSRQAALDDSAVGTVGLEAETHLVDLDAAARRVPWDRVDAMLARASQGMTP